MSTDSINIKASQWLRKRAAKKADFLGLGALAAKVNPWGSDQADAAKSLKGMSRQQLQSQMKKWNSTGKKWNNVSGVLDKAVKSNTAQVIGNFGRGANDAFGTTGLINRAGNLIGGMGGNEYNAQTVNSVYEEGNLPQWARTSARYAGTGVGVAAQMAAGGAGAAAVGRGLVTGATKVAPGMVRAAAGAAARAGTNPLVNTAGKATQWMATKQFNNTALNMGAGIVRSGALGAASMVPVAAAGSLMPTGTQAPQGSLRKDILSAAGGIGSGMVAGAGGAFMNRGATTLYQRLGNMPAISQMLEQPGVERTGITQQSTLTGLAADKLKDAQQTAQASFTPLNEQYNKAMQSGNTAEAQRLMGQMQHIATDANARQQAIAQWKDGKAKSMAMSNAKDAIFSDNAVMSGAGRQYYNATHSGVPVAEGLTNSLGWAAPGWWKVPALIGSHISGSKMFGRDVDAGMQKALSNPLYLKKLQTDPTLRNDFMALAGTKIEAAGKQSLDAINAINTLKPEDPKYKEALSALASNKQSPAAMKAIETYASTASPQQKQALIKKFIPDNINIIDFAQGALKLENATKGTDMQSKIPPVIGGMLKEHVQDKVWEHVKKNPADINKAISLWFRSKGMDGMADFSNNGMAFYGTIIAMLLGVGIPMIGSLFGGGGDDDDQARPAALGRGQAGDSYAYTLRP